MNLIPTDDSRTLLMRTAGGMTESASHQFGRTKWTISVTLEELKMIDAALGYFGRVDHYKRPKGRGAMTRIRELRRRIENENENRKDSAEGV